MIKQQRRVFLKVIASAPLLGCAGANPDAPNGGSAGAGGNGSAGASFAGAPATGGGGSGNNAAGAAGSPSVSGGNSAGGSPVTTGGSAGAPAAAGAPAGMAGATSTNPGMVVGKVSDFPVGSFTIAASIFFIGRDAGGLRAMSMQCTHKFCSVEFSGNDLDCPCHHSRFDRMGKVLVGPATTPLPHYAVYVDRAGNVSVDKFTIVSSSVRTPVPA